MIGMLVLGSIPFMVVVIFGGHLIRGRPSLLGVKACAGRRHARQP